jgi:DNA-binding transcriptional LysR family regulator
MPDVNWNAIYGFWMVAKYGSFAEAARALPRGTVQALNKRVRQLETAQNLDLRLFRSRGVKGVELTEAGRRLHALFDPVFGSFDVIAAELRGEDSGPLALAATSYAAYNYVPEILTNFHKAFPMILTTLRVRNSTEVLSLVNKGLVDFGICAMPIGPTSLAAAARTPSRIGLVAPRNHRLVHGSITWAEVVRERLVLHERTSMLRQAFEDLMQRKNLTSKLQIAAEVDSSELAFEMVRAGFGVALVPIGHRDRARLKGLATIRPPQGLPNLDGAIFYRPDRYLPKYMAWFLETATNVIQNSARGSYPSGLS